MVSSFSFTEQIAYKINKLILAGRKLSRNNLREIIQDLPRHNAFAYINNGTLPESYFREVVHTLQNGYMYLVITQSKSASSEVIGAFTDRKYNHVSLSFDRELHTIISYNGGEQVAPPGLNAEVLEQLTKREGASVMVYRLLATYEQKKQYLIKSGKSTAKEVRIIFWGWCLKLHPNPILCFAPSLFIQC